MAQHKTETSTGFIPKTEAGRIFLSLREEYIRKGGKLLTLEQVRRETAARRSRGGAK